MAIALGLALGACVVEPTNDELVFDEGAEEDPEPEDVVGIRRPRASSIELESPTVDLEWLRDAELLDAPIDLALMRLGPPPEPGEDDRPHLLALSPSRGQLDVHRPPGADEDEWPLVGSFFTGADPLSILEVSVEGRTMPLVTTADDRVMLLAPEPEQANRLEFPVRVYNHHEGFDALTVGDVDMDGDDDLVVVIGGQLRLMMELSLGIGANPENPPNFKGMSVIVDDDLDALGVSVVPGASGGSPWLVVSRRDSMGGWIYDLSSVGEGGPSGQLEPEAIDWAGHAHALARGPCSDLPLILGLVQGGVRGLDPSGGLVSPSSTSSLTARGLHSSGSATVMEAMGGELWLDTACLDAPRRVPLTVPLAGHLAIAEGEAGVFMALSRASPTSVALHRAR